MTEKTEIKQEIIDSPGSEVLEKSNSEIQLLDDMIRDFAPEIENLYQIQEDDSEEIQVKTGQLNENRILGIILKSYLEGIHKVTTSEVYHEYKKYFKKIARSTISTYLNTLKRESTLYKEREGRIVYYIFAEKPPIGFNPFWFIRIFCIAPAYFDRALIFSKIYHDARKYLRLNFDEFSKKNEFILIRNFRFITGLIVLKILKNRCSKCMICQFSNKERLSKVEKIINSAIKDRTDFLPKHLIDNVIEKYSEIPLFNGTIIKEDLVKEIIAQKIIRNVISFENDLDFQIMVSERRDKL